MNAQFLPLFLFCLLLLLLRRNAASPDDPPAPALAPGHPTASKDEEFVKRSCQKATHQDLCLATLSGYASAIRQDPAKLADFAIQVSILKAKETAAYFKIARVDHRFDTDIAYLLHDCYRFFSKAVELLNVSIHQLRGIGGSAEHIRSQISDLQSTMNSTSTTEDTCKDGFKGRLDSPIKNDVTDRTNKANEFTGNAIDLVDNYLAKFKTA